MYGYEMSTFQNPTMIYGYTVFKFHTHTQQVKQ